MDDTTFEFDQHDVDAASRRFPSHRRAAPPARPDVDMSYLRSASGAEFGRHVWDEGGHV